MASRNLASGAPDARPGDAGHRSSSFARAVAGMRRPTPVGLEEIGHHGKDGKDGKDERSLGFANRSEASRNWLDMPFRRTHANACERRPESTSWGSLVRAQYRPSEKPRTRGFSFSSRATAPIYGASLRSHPAARCHVGATLA
jgi:hypothetical protein